MATAENNEESKELEEKTVSPVPKKPRRSIFRSMSWKRKNKRTIMEENGEDTTDEAVVGKHFDKSAEQHEVSDNEDESDLNKTATSSKKRKRLDVWKAMKKMFRRKGSKSSKSFTEGDASSPRPHPPRSLSDPNLISRSERPDIAPLDQVEMPLNNEPSTSISKKALSHDSLISELRGNSKPAKLEVVATVTPQPQGIDWQLSPTTDSNKFVPGLNVSRDKIRVAPRDRRAPSRKYAASVRQGGRVIKDEDVRPRIYSADDSSKNKMETNLSSLKEVKHELEMEEKEKLKEEKFEENNKLNGEDSQDGGIINDTTTQLRVSTEELFKNDVIADQEKDEMSDFKDLAESLRSSQTETVVDENGENEISKVPSPTPSQEKDTKENISTCKDQHEDNELEENIGNFSPVQVTPVILPKVYDEEDQQTIEEDQQTIDSKALPSPSSPSLKIELDVSEKSTKNDLTVSDDVSSPESPESVTAPDLKISDKTPELDVIEPAILLPSPTVDVITQSDTNLIEKQATVLSETTPDTVENESVKEISKTTPEHLPSISDLVSSDVKETKTEENMSPVHSPNQDIFDIPLPKGKENNQETKSADPKALPLSKSKRLNIETPEKVFVKPIMRELKTNGNDEISSNEPARIKKRHLSFHEQTDILTERVSKDDSSLGVNELKQTFERSYRANTISYSERKKKPDVKPKPKFERQIPSDKSKSLGRNHRFPVTTKNAAEKSLETSSETPEQQSSNKSDLTVKSVPAKREKPPVSNRPKPPPKPKIVKDTKVESNGNEKTERNIKPSNVNEVGDKENNPENNDASSEVTMPSFWAKRNVFSPNVTKEKTLTTPPESPEKKPKEGSKPIINLKTDSCAVCGAKVYQMEKFKVKDNIVHRNCIKCSVCKRLLSVGNFIMSKNKIYCKPHEPSSIISISM